MSTCRCSMAISMLGDGCRYCQPQTYIAHLLETLEDARAAPVSEAKAQGQVGFRVKTQGIQFGKAWYSHESITGRTAESLNDGTCGLTARQYMDWVRSALAAAPAAPAADAGVNDHD